MGRRRELIVLLLIGAVVTAGLWALLIRPKSNQAAAAQADEQVAANEAESLRGQIRALEAARADADGLRTRARQAKDLFPGRPALADLTNALQKVADQSGVDLMGIQPAPPSVSPTTPDLAVVATTVTVGGGFFEIEDFLTRLENLVKSPDPASRIPPRSVLVRSVNVAAGSGGGAAAVGGGAGSTGTAGEGELSASISMVVFQHAKAAPGATAAGATGAPTTTAPTATTTPPASATTRPPAYQPPAQGRR